MSRLISAAALLVLVLGGPWMQPAAGTREPVTHRVEIRGFEFHPDELTVSRGDTVVWVNRDIAPHTATAENGAWSSESLATGESWELVVEDEGVRRYYCAFHPLMTGDLEVR